MVLIHLTGKITENGKLEVDLPEGLPPGDVQITLEMPTEEEIPWEERPWTDEELADMLKTEPKTGAEIAAEIEAGLLGGGWSDITISGAEWVEEQRRKNERKFPKW
jgi:hypothetical protein